MKSSTPIETPISKIVRSGWLLSANIPNAAPGFFACTMSKNPGMTVKLCHSSTVRSIHSFVARSSANTVAAISNRYQPEIHWRNR